MIVSCVRTGDKFGPEYVHRLENAVRRHLPIQYRFVCLTDSDCRGLPGWWGKMCLLEPSWRRDERVLYFDLDTVPVGDLSPLAELDVQFGICDNFARLAGNDWPCAYNSSVMTIAPNWGGDVWDAFETDRDGIMARAGRYGDQKAIEELVPDAALLQEHLPTGFFVGYRELSKHAVPPPSCSIVVFAGSHKPHNTNCKWVQKAWICA